MISYVLHTMCFLCMPITYAKVRDQKSGNYLQSCNSTSHAVCIIYYYWSYKSNNVGNIIHAAQLVGQPSAKVFLNMHMHFTVHLLAQLKLHVILLNRSSIAMAHANNNQYISSSLAFSRICPCQWIGHLKPIAISWHNHYTIVTVKQTYQLYIKL